MSTTRFPPTPTISVTTIPTSVPSIAVSTISTSVPSFAATTIPSVPPVPINDSNPINSSLSSTTGPSSNGWSFGSSVSGLSTFDLSNPTASGVMMSTTVVYGIFGVGANFDPLIIFGLVLAGLLFLFLLGALIYCCCVHCGPPNGQPVIKRTASFQTIRQERAPARPIYLTASFSPEYSSSAEDPAASVFLEQPLRVSVGAYAAGNGGRMRQQMMLEEHPVVVRTLARKKYLYPADIVGGGNDFTYNTIRPNIISRGTPITTLGDGYAIGHSLRSTGNNYGSRNLLLYEDDSAPRIITLY